MSGSLPLLTGAGRGDAPTASQATSPGRHPSHVHTRPWRWSIMRLCWWRHPGYIGVRRRDFYAWRRP